MNGELRRKEKLGSRVEIPGLCLFSPRRLPAVRGHSERAAGIEPAQTSLEGWSLTVRLCPQRPIQGVGFRAHESSTRVAAKGRDTHRGRSGNRTRGARGHTRFPGVRREPTSASLPGEVVLHSGTPLPSFYSHNLQSVQGESNPHPMTGSHRSYRWTMHALDSPRRESNPLCLSSMDAAP
jgi:hypothetical protein